MRRGVGNLLGLERAARGRIEHDADEMAASTLLGGKIEDVAENSADRRPDAMNNPKTPAWQPKRRSIEHACNSRVNIHAEGLSTLLYELSGTGICWENTK